MSKGTPFPHSVIDVELGLASLYPNYDRSIFNPLLERIKTASAAPESVASYLDLANRRKLATDLARAAIDFSDGGNYNQGRLSELAIAIDSTDPTPTEELNKEFVTNDLQELFIYNKVEKGLRWRLDSLNKSLGSLRRGDFGFIFARPETGKTTFLASEVTHMALQEPVRGRVILWFNNEEQGQKVMTRCYQAALGLKLNELYADIMGNREKYQKLIGDSIFIKDDASLTKSKVEEVCRKHNPALIIFDQIDKIRGFDAERYDLQMKAIYQWARELAKTYGPVIGVCQAGGTGDGKKWLTMNDVDSSHTAKQGEADWMLGIGKTYEHGQEELRFLHICKNKLQGDEDSIPEMRHGRIEVIIQPEIARYKDYD